MSSKTEPEKPRITPQLIEWLEWAYKRPRYSPSDSLERIMYEEGKQEVIRKLKERLETK